MRQSWVKLNPGWEVRLWTDVDLHDFMTRYHPDMLDIYTAYPNSVQRADCARYLIMHEFGGVYADIDASCLSSLDVLSAEDRIVLSCEPSEHAVDHAPKRGLNRLVANCVMASPPGHSFWLHVKSVMVRNRHARDVLETTGPLLLTGCVETWDRPDDLAVSSCHLFNPLTKAGLQSADELDGPHGTLNLAIHHWAGSWYRPIVPTFTQRLKGRLRKCRHFLMRGRRLKPQAILPEIRPGVDRARSRPAIDRDCAHIAVLMPVRDAERFLDQSFELLRALDFPKDRMKLVFCEGDSLDGTRRMLEKAMPELNTQFKSAKLLTYETGFNARGRPRWHPALQRKRRSAIARVRNHLIQHGLDYGDDWALWIDADVVHYPADVLTRLLSLNADIVVPDCVLESGGHSFDMNSFLDVGPVSDALYYRQIRGGLFQPNSNYPGRRHLHDLRYLDRVPLTGVGGTMLLVRAHLHLAGLTFPEIAYKNLIETEAFGRLANDCAIVPMGMPNLEIRHVNG